MTRIIIEAVPPDKQRLPIYASPMSGDWFIDHSNGDIHIRVTGTDAWAQEDVFLIALHELIEARLCFKAGITQGAVDAFDTGYRGDGEPGDDPAAPYQKQHRQAMIVEHVVAMMLGLWDYGEIK